MNKIKLWVQKPLIAAICGLVVGLIIGLPLLGWLIWPVQWYDAAPYHMRKDLQQEFMCMAIDSYAANSTNPLSQQLAIKRFHDMGDQGSPVLAQLIANPGVCQTTSLAAIQAYGTLVSNGVTSTPLAGGVTGTTSGTTKTPSNSGSVVLLILLCVVTIAVGAALFYVFVLRNRKAHLAQTKPERVFTNEPPPPTPSGHTVPVQENTGGNPISQFMTTYTVGDDLYDDSFSIDSPTGEFLGECGVGISETIGVGDPKKVTAFEVWLFDKNDIQTVTKILMSQHAYNDPGYRQKLMSKGELILIEPGQKVLLETASLQLEVKVIDANYGQGALPSGSYMDRLTLELDVWPKV
jgi:hypothetical protein